MNAPHKIPRRRDTACNRLAEKFGGTWKYFGFFRWFECDDGRRVSAYIVGGSYDEFSDRHIGGVRKFIYSVDHSDVTKIIRPNGFW